MSSKKWVLVFLVTVFVLAALLAALPAGCTARNGETLPGDDPLSALDEGGAKYMLQIRIRYEKE